jgi:hypothetical protein
MNLSSLDIEVMVIVGVALLVAALAWLYMHRRKTQALRQKSGSEYNPAVLVNGKLAELERRIGKLTLRDLDSFENERFAKQWEDIQSRFVDSPKEAVLETEDLVSALMRARGYPVSDFDQRAADISVDHPKVVENYRSARVGKLEATTDELRAAMIHYRALYDELMQVTPPLLVNAAS